MSILEEKLRDLQFVDTEGDKKSLMKDLLEQYIQYGINAWMHAKEETDTEAEPATEVEPATEAEVAAKAAAEVAIAELKLRVAGSVSSLKKRISGMLLKPEFRRKFWELERRRTR